MRDEGIITGQGQNSEVICTQAENNKNETYCECLQAQLCVDVEKQPDEFEKAIYTYRSGEDILQPFSYNVSFWHFYTIQIIFSLIIIGEMSAAWSH